MKIQYTSPYDDEGPDCSKCEKHINVEEGLYHCEEDEEDYHKECVIVKVDEAKKNDETKDEEKQRKDKNKSGGKGSNKNKSGVEM